MISAIGRQETHIAPGDTSSADGFKFNEVIKELAYTKGVDSTGDGDPKRNENEFERAVRDAEEQLRRSAETGGPVFIDQEVLRELMRRHGYDIEKGKDELEELWNLGGEEFSSLAHMGTRVGHDVFGFGEQTQNFVSSHAREIGLSAGAAAALGGVAEGAVDATPFLVALF